MERLGRMAHKHVLLLFDSKRIEEGWKATAIRIWHS